MHTEFIINNNPPDNGVPKLLKTFFLWFELSTLSRRTEFFFKIKLININTKAKNTISKYKLLKINLSNIFINKFLLK